MIPRDDNSRHGGYLGGFLKLCAAKLTVPPPALRGHYLAVPTLPRAPGRRITVAADNADDAIAVPLRAALDELERRLRSAHRSSSTSDPVRRHPRWTTLLGGHGLEAPVELETLWGWHDGTDSIRYEDNQLVGHWHLFSLEQAADHHRVHREVYDDPLSDPAGYPRGWFPALLYWNGPFAAIDCGSRERGERPLYIVNPHGDYPLDPPAPDFPSLRNLIETLVRFFDLGLVDRDEKTGGATVPWERIPEELRQVGYW